MLPRLTTLLALGLLAAPAAAQDFTVPAARDADAVVLTGKQLGPEWAAPENVTLAIPEKDMQCYLEEQDVACPDGYNHYQAPDVDTGELVAGSPTDRILGYRWDGERFAQIPFQVDEVFTRYLNNNASGFGIYSGTDKHTTYAYDREGFRFTENGGENGCVAQMKEGDAVAGDPVRGLDTNDELAFMFADAGPQAPEGAQLPDGIEGVKTVTLLDPTNPSAEPRYVYVALAAENGPKPAFDASNGYVHYQRDKDADTLVYSASNYEDYGPAKQGPYCTADGEPVLNPDGTRKIGPRKPLDGTTISTARYRWRYDGRWLMTAVRIAGEPQDPFTPSARYGPDLVDRWKARAFAQDPASKTPCCGYEEEDTNWGGSSSLLGEKVGPVRAIRETWGADSGTNVIRRETFYRERMVQKTWLRVHVIPPADGIYAQWDFNAGRMTKFFNANNPEGVDVDGVNDEAYGNFDDPCNERWDDNGRTDIDRTYRSAYQELGVCDLTKQLADSDPSGNMDHYHLSMDPGDLTFADANAALGWSQTSGPWGTIVDRIHSEVTDLTPGGAVQSLAAVPYYRDDACFDDGTGADPGPELHPRHFEEEQASRASDGSERRCWTPEDGPTGKAPHGDARGDDRFWQGDIGTHGLHILFLVDSDNARTTVPLTEMVSDWDLIMLPPDQTWQDGQAVNVGERYGRQFEKPLVTVVS